MTRPCALVVDSGAAVDHAPDRGVHVVPLRIVFGAEVLRDGVDISPEEFYARLGHGPLPTTSTPSPGEYLEAMREADAQEVICLTIPAGLSAMHGSATLASKLLADSGDARPVTVIDTGNAAAGFALVARAAAELCAAGAARPEVAARVDMARHEVRMFGTLRTMAHLARSGRVPSLAAGVSDLLGVRPIFELREGEAHRTALVRSAPRVVRTMQRLATENFPADLPIWLMVFHSAAADAAADLREALHAVCRVERSELCALSPVMGAYTGPGTTGFAAMPLRGAELQVVP